MMLWRSEPIPREYVRGTRSFSDPKLPDTITEELADMDEDGIPDSV